MAKYCNCISAGGYGGRLLRGDGLDGFYRNTNGFLKFVLGILGWIWGCLGGHFGGLIAEVQGAGELGTAAGEAGCLDGFGQEEEQEFDLCGDGGVVFGGQPAGSAVDRGADGYRDVSCCWHGLVFLFGGLVSGTDWLSFGAGIAPDASLNTSVRR